MLTFLIWSLSDLSNLISHQPVWVQILAPVPTSHMLFGKMLRVSQYLSVLSCNTATILVPPPRLVKAARGDGPKMLTATSCISPAL